MDQRENRELNIPAKKFFDRKLKCAFSTSEFRFSAGQLDVLAYDRKEKCFHVAEGKMARRISSVGHAVGQLVAYISMLQESGFDFLDRISKEANLYLTDFVQFLDTKTIKVCFYVVLPERQRSVILDPALLVLKNVGDFGAAIGVLFSDGKCCRMEKEPHPINVKIRKRYTRGEFLSAISERFSASRQGQDLEPWPTPHQNLVQFRERDGNARLHFEVAFRRKKKTDTVFSYETAFHLEWGTAWQKDPATRRRANRIRRVMRGARRLLRAQGYRFVYQDRWGEAWSRLYMQTKTLGPALDDEEVSRCLRQLQAVADALLPLLKRINWGRRRKKFEEEDAERT